MSRRTGPSLAVLAVLLAVGGGVVAAGGYGFGGAAGSGGSNRDAGLPPATARVTRQTLVDTKTETGTLSYGDATSVTGRIAGTLTALPAVGTALTRGAVLCRVDNSPVVLLYGGLPAYRALTIGVKGSDVTQFERNLAALGYRGFTVDDTFSASTAAAVKKWQGDLGLPKTGSVDLGRVVYAPGGVRVDEQKAAVGDAVAPGTALLTYTGTSRVAVAELDVADQRLAHTGATVKVTLPDGGSVAGRIGEVRTVVKPAEGQDPAETKIQVTVTISEQKALAGLDEASVDLAFTAGTHPNVLTVPVAALLALAEGGYGVQVIDGASSRIVAVQTGLFAGGRVEVSGDGLAAGMSVGIPS